MTSHAFIVVTLVVVFKALNAKSIHSLPTIEEFDEAIDKYGNTHLDIKNNNCTVHELKTVEVKIHTNGAIYLSAYNLTFPAELQILVDNHSNICFNRSLELLEDILRHCEKWIYDEEDFTLLDDGRVWMFNETLEPGTFNLRDDGTLEMCALDVDDYDNDTGPAPTDMPFPLTTARIYISNIGSGISIVALIAHLIIFCLAPSLRNLPGYSLASMSVAFLMAYSSLLISQIPEVLGMSCIVFAVMTQYFFLAAFCCMNTMSFDIWRTLKMATTQLSVHSHKTKRRLFLLYSVYTWGIPLTISTTSVILDNVDGVPKWLRPQFGAYDSCWMNNDEAKTVLFSIPSFALFLINAVFFVFSAFIIKNNSMKSTSDESRQTVRLNFIMYVRLGLLMGVTWIFGFISTLSDNITFWVIFELLNSLQGLFVFLLFSCSKKVIRSLKEKIQMKGLQSPKTSTFENKTSSTN